MVGLFIDGDFYIAIYILEALVFESRVLSYIHTNLEERELLNIKIKDVFSEHGYPFVSAVGFYKVQFATGRWHNWHWF